MANVLREKIQEDIKNAMRNKENLKLITLRMLLAEIKKADIEKRVDAKQDRETALLDDIEILAVLNRMIKQRLDSVEQYQKANRQDLADKESAEVVILRNYLPKSLSEDEVQELVALAIAETDAQSLKDMGKVMAFIKERAQGRADMGKVSALVKQQLIINN